MSISLLVSADRSTPTRAGSSWFLPLVLAVNVPCTRGRWRLVLLRGRCDLLVWTRRLVEHMQDVGPPETLCHAARIFYVVWSVTCYCVFLCGGDFGLLLVLLSCTRSGSDPRDAYASLGLAKNHVGYKHFLSFL